MSALAFAAAKFLREFDAEVANRDGENPLVDAGCLECTAGTVPNDKNTGLCGYHMLQRELARPDPQSFEAFCDELKLTPAERLAAAEHLAFHRFKATLALGVKS